MQSLEVFCGILLILCSLTYEVTFFTIHFAVDRVHELNFNSVPNTQAVKKARTAEFINSLPSIFEEDINPSHENAEPKSSNSADDKLREAHMTTCFGELASSIGHSLVILRKKRYGKISKYFNLSFSPSHFKKLFFFFCIISTLSFLLTPVCEVFCFKFIEIENESRKVVSVEGQRSEQVGNN